MKDVPDVPLDAVGRSWLGVAVLRFQRHTCQMRIRCRNEPMDAVPGMALKLRW
jgi:hypothetical protein